MFVHRPCEKGNETSVAFSGSDGESARKATEHLAEWIQTLPPEDVET